MFVSKEVTKRFAKLAEPRHSVIGASRDARWAGVPHDVNEANVNAVRVAQLRDRDANPTKSAR